MQRIEIVLPGNLRIKKNSKRIYSMGRFKEVLPSEAYVEWEEQAIESEQVAAAKLKEEVEGKIGNGKQGDLFGGVSDPAPGGIKPLESRMLGRQQVSLNGPAGNVIELQTPKDKERELREQIDERVGKYARQYNVKKQAVNGHLIVLFGKPRAEMRLSELEGVLKYCRREMPVRDGFHKAAQINVRWT